MCNWKVTMKTRFTQATLGLPWRDQVPGRTHSPYLVLQSCPVVEQWAETGSYGRHSVPIDTVLQHDNSTSSQFQSGPANPSKVWRSTQVKQTNGYISSARTAVASPPQRSTNNKPISWRRWPFSQSLSPSYLDCRPLSHIYLCITEFRSGLHNDPLVIYSPK
jgi:hypothetical protein